MHPLTPLLAALLLWITHTMGWDPSGTPPAFQMVSEKEFLAMAYPDVPPEQHDLTVPLRAFYHARTDTIVLPEQAGTLSDETLQVLVHELTHALQARQGRVPALGKRSPEVCESRYQLEREAEMVENLWRQGGGRPPNALSVEPLMAKLACLGH